MTDQSKESKFDPTIHEFISIVSSGVVTDLDKYLHEIPIKVLLDTLKAIEPRMVVYGKTVVDEVSTYFIENGISGRTEKAIRDACFTCFVKGFLLYKYAIKQYDTNKLAEIYGADYEAYENALIDKFLLEHKIKSSGNI